MGMPVDVGVVDTMMGLPRKDSRWWIKSFGSMVHDAESKESLKHAAGYMYKDLPEPDLEQDPVEHVIKEMDTYNIERSLLPVSESDTDAQRAVREHPDRFSGSFHTDPNSGMDGVRALERAVKEWGVVAAQAFPAGYVPQVPINHKSMYPLYAKCVELNIPMFINAGVPGPRVPMECQDVRLLDEVCWFFPELKIVTRHGCEPWEELMVKLMVKWPNLYYSTSAFAPRYYPSAIIEYANKRGADKVMYAGYYPSGLSLERIFREMPGVPFTNEVWPKFLRENALNVLGLA
jgi:predicted TIM-barrel fold metal-dependent hydrolase